MRLPNWPLLMDAGTAARYLTYSRAQFKALVIAGLVPPPREHLPGLARWHRDELDACMARLWNLRKDREHAAQAGQDLDARIDAFDPAAPRAAQARGRHSLSVLPPRRRLPPAAGA
jgi:hypothetical protein